MNTAKILVGKGVEDSMLAYLSEVDHRAAFIKLHERMRLTETKSVSQTRDAAELETKVAQLERIINAIAAIDPDIVEKARAFVSTRLQTWRLENQLMKPLEEMSPIEILELYGKMLESTKPKKQLTADRSIEPRPTLFLYLSILYWRGLLVQTTKSHCSYFCSFFLLFCHLTISTMAANGRLHNAIAAKV